MLVRETQYGKVEGILEEDIEVFYGIPYGKEPKGDLKWKAPHNCDNWIIKDCTKRKELVMQITSRNEVIGTLDALHLDVYTMENAQDWPVIFFVHGGNNQTGKSFEIPGNYIVKKDKVVYVTIDYRLGLYGFNNLPCLLDTSNPTGNFTLLDIAKALQWVKDNISYFGGNPNNVTVSGFSSGGRDVMAMLISPLFKGLFHKAIVYSGGMTIANEIDSQKVLASRISSLVLEDGICTSKKDAIVWLLQNKEEVRNYLYSLDEKRLISLFPGAGIRMARFPHLYNDGIVIPSNGFDSIYINDVPIIMITGTEEFSFFWMFDPSMKKCVDKENSEQFISNYGGEFYRNFNTQHSAAMMKNQYKSNMYLCQINYGDSNSKVPIPMFGSFHGIFVPMLSPNEHGYGFYDFKEPGYLEMANQYHEYISSFVRTGIPSGLVKWEPWDEINRNTLILDAEDGKSKIYSDDVYKSNREIICEMEKDSLNDGDKMNLIQNVLNGRWFSKDLDAHFHNKDLWDE